MELNRGKVCSCGKRHVNDAVKALVVQRGALEEIPRLLKEMGCQHPFVIMDLNTKAAAGNEVVRVLERAHMPLSVFVYETTDPVPPTEEELGKVVMRWDPEADGILAVGSGVINDLSKFVSRATGRHYILVLTAPSMDGMVSPTSSVDVDGLKVSLPSATAWAVVADLDVLANSPRHMIASGLGDMLAKYISLTEWKLSNLINGEYYCPEIAAMIRKALDSELRAAPRLLQGDCEAVKEVTDGLLLAGCAMAYAGVTRPASGMEHYISHIIDMRHLAFGTPCDLHGIQCGVATLYALRMYERIQRIDHVDIQKANAYAANFSYEKWKQVLRSYVGPAAESMIALEAKERKYDLAEHAKRLEVIARKWPEIRQVVATLPKAEKVEKVMRSLSMPTRLEEVGVETRNIPTHVKCTKDIRKKYVGSWLLWDIGMLDEIVGK
ncbi:MAG: sn-glycerol-1-phosphate dehydrogenase [Sphaerochaetaceae bacterium]|nr:sn-glycerol-1-phosphate dehydrogenase [Spirochaetales bacterium]MDY5499754.1 sn-glycerol-1-phosphate dehydrogenase [Sphaerochaetaceae bacterium]